MFLKDERGSILPIVAVAVVVLLTVAAAAIDFARYSAASEKLKTATEAAALAGAASGERYVKLEIDSMYTDCCGFDCTPCCRECEPKIITGKEKDLVDDEGWRQYCCNCECSMKILDRWVEYEGNNAESAAEMFFWKNIPREMDIGQGGNAWIDRITVHKERSDPRYPTVTVEAAGRVKTIFLDFMNKLAPGFDFSYLRAKRCTQSETRYIELNGKFVKTAVDDDCE